MLLTPFVSTLSAPAYAWTRRWRAQPPAPVVPLTEQELQGHIIIAGYGRVGRYTADLLRRLELAHVVIERDQGRLDDLKAAGVPVIYGDAGSPVVLGAARLQHARLLLVAVSAAIDVETIVRQARVLNPQLHIVARATQLGQLEVLRGLGIHEVVQPEFEAGLEMVRQALLHVEVAPAEIERLSDEVRAEQYRPLETLGTSAATLRRLRRLRRGVLDLAWYTLDQGSPLVGQSISGSAVRQQTGVSIVALLRGDAVVYNPTPETQLWAGDQIAVLGTTSQRAAFAELLTPPLDTSGSVVGSMVGAPSSN